LSDHDPIEPLPVINDEPGSSAAAVPCRHLRSKGMYVYTDGVSTNPHPDYDNTIYWCLKTMKAFGPDDELVDGDDCRRDGRPCYNPY
jgi:hypothetical protein